jgi:hypothetical protein
MKYFKLINILYELIIFIIFISLSSYYNYLRIYIVILLIPLVSSITIRAREKHSKRMISSNFSFGFIAGIIFFGLSYFSIPSGVHDEGFIKLGFYILTVPVSCIVGLLAVLLGWILNKAFDYFNIGNSKKEI